MIENKIAFVTGASSGIGRQSALLLAARGYYVFGGSRRAPDDLAAGSNFEWLQLDVTDEAGVERAVRSVLVAAGRVDLLVNNAGYSLTGALEETTLAEARQQFETNFFGALRVTQAVLPVMRERRSGRIVNVSSVLGFLPAPYMGIYAATKHALEAYTETLDLEVREFGIRALLVEPYYTRTSIGENGRRTQRTCAAYDLPRQRVVTSIQRHLAAGDDPRAVAAAIHRAATAERPRLRYPVGRGVTLTWLRRLVPASLFDRTFRRQFRLDAPPAAPAHFTGSVRT